MMDLAALRIRDTIKNIGDLSAFASRYEEVTGIPVDHDVVEFHTVLYNAISVVSVWPPLVVPVPGADWLSYLAWYVNGARWAFECIAEMRGYELEPVTIPDPRPTRHAPAFRHLVDGLRAAGAPVTGAGCQSMPAKAPAPAQRAESANHRASSSWCAPSTVTANTPDRRIWRHVHASLRSETRISMGSMETDVNELTVIACGIRPAIVLTTVTPVANCPDVSRKRRARSASSSASALGRRRAISGRDIASREPLPQPVEVVKPAEHLLVREPEVDQAGELVDAEPAQPLGGPLRLIDGPE